MLENIKWVCHDCFKITGEKTIYTDPYNIKKPDKADLIFITHTHFDHFSPDDIRKISGQNTAFVVPHDCAFKLTGNVKVAMPGDKFTVSGIEVEAVPAYNTNKNFHPKANNWLGYIFKVNGIRIYLAGDTDHIPEMRALSNIDIAFLPVSGTYVMTADEAAAAALDIKPKIAAIPMHYATIVGTKEDAKRFAELLEGKIKVYVPNAV
ncbi:MAG: MBL fold metallo-hydrolase [Nitrospirae bacterium]|nr:MBL fold metallo-hydrolase [Nitrospirota bacterium]